MFYRFITVIFFFILTSCWNKNFQEPGRIEIEEKPTTMPMPGNFEKTWAATQAVLSKFPIEKRDADKVQKKAFIVTDWVRSKSDVLFHGFGDNRFPYVIRYKLYIYLLSSPEDNSTRITVKNIEHYLDDVITSGVDFQGSVNTWIATESSTAKEYALLAQIRNLIADPNFKTNGRTLP